MHEDDISNVLILNKKSIANQENKLFEAELEKFRSHQNRLLQASHKQTALMKELTKLYGDLLQDKRVRSEQAKYEGFTRQRNSVLSRYRKIFQAFNDLIAGLTRARSFYSEMGDTVESLSKNVEAFVNNRREEGGQLLGNIERAKTSSADGQADRERERLQQLMERMTVNQSSPTRSKSSATRPPPLARASQPSSAHGYQPPTSPPYNANPPLTHYSMPPTHAPAAGYPPNGAYHEPHRQAAYPAGYDPMQYPYQARSPPANQGYPPQAGYPYPQQLPPGFVPPPPPPGPPPGTQGYVYGAPPSKQGTGNPQGTQDPWAGLSVWK